MKRGNRLCALSAALFLGSVNAAWAQALPDPTRPPQQWLDAQAKPAGTPPPSEQEQVQDAAPQLQSLMVGPAGRYAILNGKIVGVGDVFRDYRVVAIAPTGVVLRSQRGSETVKLFPDVEKRAAKAVVASNAGQAPARAKRRIVITGIEDQGTKDKK
jgi:MSHA biogenesis protein MshK